MATWTLTPAICGPRTLPDQCGSRPGPKDIVLDGVVGDVRLKDENGAVELHMTKPGSMQVENRNGDIQIFLPDKAAFHLDARTRDGEVQSDFEQFQVNNSVTRQQRREQSATVGRNWWLPTNTVQSSCASGQRWQ